MTTPSTPDSTRPHTWILGLDLRPSSQGAVRFAKWLDTRAGERNRVIGVHVLEEAHLQAALRYHHLSELRKAAHAAAEMILAREGADETVAEHHVVQGIAAERSLEAAVEYHHAGGLVVGRQAPREGHHALRLGRVARRLLRSLEVPTIVVPPDYEPPEDDGGPVLLTTNLRSDSDAAARFAASLAKRIGRPLHALHVVPHADDYGAHYIPEESRKKIAKEHEAEGKADMAKWLEWLSVTPDSSEVVLGQVNEQVRNAVDRHGASMIVCGSRRLSTLERFLLTSVGSELAATIPAPVCVVPPGDRK